MLAQSSVSSSTPPSSARTSGGSRAGGWHWSSDESQSIRKVGAVPQEVRQSEGFDGGHHDMLAWHPPACPSPPCAGDGPAPAAVS